MSSSLRIVRTTDFPDRYRNYRVVLDGKVVGKLARDGALTIPLAPGAHTLAVRIDWCGSRTLALNVRAGEEAVFHCGSALTGWRMLCGLFYMLFLPDRYLQLAPQTRAEPPLLVPAALAAT